MNVQLLIMNYILARILLLVLIDLPIAVVIAVRTC